MTGSLPGVRRSWAYGAFTVTHRVRSKIETEVVLQRVLFCSLVRRGRNLRPYFKFTAPLVEPSDEELEIWTRYRKGDADADTLKALLTKVRPQTSPRVRHRKDSLSMKSMFLTALVLPSTTAFPNIKWLRNRFVLVPPKLIYYPAAFAFHR